MTPGRVFSHVGHRFEEGEYDVVIVGGGRLGLACAYFLRRLAPDARVLIVERDGIPSEGGATITTAGVWSSLDLPPRWEARAEWTREVWLDPAALTGVRRPHDPRFR
ncbi:FAD-dependent oxidoreductase, partial [Deinococcus pimensis]|uniref:FAD-dependent oxidoreductase n=1 Tax=Deinococcus pimensis TaxID=309888 RepID=UPI0012F9671B